MPLKPQTSIPRPRYPMLKVVLYHWVNCELLVERQLVETMDAAVLVISTTKCNTFKVYDQQGHVARSGHGGHYYPPYYDELTYYESPYFNSPYFDSPFYESPYFSADDENLFRG